MRAFVAQLVEGVNEETHAGVHPLKESAANGEWSVQVINDEVEDRNGYGVPPLPQ